MPARNRSSVSIFPNTSITGTSRKRRLPKNKMPRNKNLVTPIMNQHQFVAPCMGNSLTRYTRHGAMYSNCHRSNKYSSTRSRLLSFTVITCIICFSNSLPTTSTNDLNSSNDEISPSTTTATTQTIDDTLDLDEYSRRHLEDEEAPTMNLTDKKDSTETYSSSASIPTNQNSIQENSDFLKWCQATLGIQTLLEIKDFEYINHFEEWKYQQLEHDPMENMPSDIHDEKNIQLPTTTVRGLAATRTIEIGEVMISVPYHSLLSLHTTIDEDPILSKILGPAQRQKYGWTLHQTSSRRNGQADGRLDFGKGGGKEISDSTSYYEIALLIIAILYHDSLGRISPHWFYIQSLKEASIDNIPFLWDDQRIHSEFDLGKMDVNGRFIEVKKQLREIQRDIREMYNETIDILIRDFAGTFAPPADTNGSNWAYSFENFQWAFAVVNSRHWHLPLQDLDEIVMDLRGIKEDPDPAVMEQVNVGMVGEDINTMPANSPTDEIVSLQDEALKLESVEEYIVPSPSPMGNENIVSKHSFMAPLADLLNFGPPCAQGQYNSKKKVFEVLATCRFEKGQEVTFWYGHDCEETFIANYGFVHPMITRCPTIDDWKYRAKMWKDYAETLEKTLSDAYEDLYDTLQDLKGCNCDDDRIRDSPPTIAKAADDHVKTKRKKVDIEELEDEEAIVLEEKDNTLEGVQQKSRQQQQYHNGQGGIRRTKRSPEEDRDDVGL